MSCRTSASASVRPRPAARRPADGRRRLHGSDAGRQSARRTAVIGIGNILMRDDGLGVHAARELSRRDLPEGVVCIDGGTAAFEALDAAGGCGDLIVLDAVSTGRPAGTICRLTPQAWRETRGVSLHDVSLLDAVGMAETLGGERISLTVIGMEPADISPGLELSPAVRGGLDRFIECVLDELKGRHHDSV